jgi:hypothetical protein
VGAFITLHSGKSWHAANWAYDAVIETIVENLPPEASALRDWLSARVTSTLGGLGRVDLSQLSPEDQQLVLTTVRKAYEHSKKVGPVGWGEPTMFPAWLERFKELVDLLPK